MKALTKEKKLFLILIGLGIFFSAFSFIYEYAISHTNNIITYIIMGLDIILLLINTFFLSYLINYKIAKSIVNSIVLSLLYFAILSGIILCCFEEKASLEILLGTIKILVYLSPSIIILLPFIFLLLLGLGG